jgi:hypothetical protein
MIVMHTADGSLGVHSIPFRLKMHMQGRTRDNKAPSRLRKCRAGRRHGVDLALLLLQAYEYDSSIINFACMQ